MIKEGEKQNRKKAVLPRKIMVLGALVSVVIGALFGAFISSNDHIGIYDSIAVGSASFTFFGFWAAFFQLRSIREMYAAEKAAANLAVGGLLRQQLIQRINEARIEIETYLQMLLEGKVEEASRHRSEIVSLLTSIKSDKHTSAKPVQLVSGYIYKILAFDASLADAMDSGGDVSSDYLRTFVDDFTFLIGILEKEQKRLVDAGSMILTKQ